MHKILLVEDDEVIRQQVKKILEQWEYEVVLVEDFMEVLSLFVKEEPHLVLMDIGLPLFNGYHWCQEFGRSPRCLLCSCLPEIRPWISLWQSIWVGTTL